MSMPDPSLQKFYYLSGTLNAGKFVEVGGVNNLNISNSVSFDNSFVLGGAQSAFQVNAPQTLNLSFDRSLIEKDYLINFTGSGAMLKASLFNVDRYYEISNLYLNEYSAAFSVGDVPKINTKFSSYGADIIQTPHLTKVNGVEIQKVTGVLEVPTLNSIFVSGLVDSEFRDLYNIYGFDYNLTINRQPLYTIGSQIPNEVDLITPIKISVAINSKLSTSATYQKIAQDHQSNVDFDIVVQGSSSSMHFPVRRAQLINTDIVASSQNTLEVKRQFVGFIYGDDTIKDSPVVVADSDPYWGFVKLLLKGNGTNGQTTFPDSSTLGNTVTCGGLATISTDQSKWTSSSIKLSKSGQQFLSVGNAAFSLGTADYAIETWVYLSSYNGVGSTLFDMRAGSFQTSPNVFIGSDGRVSFLLKGFTNLETSSSPISLGEWHHIAVARTAGITRVYVDGGQIGSDYSVLYSSTNTGMVIGTYYGTATQFLDGYLNDFRLTVGSSRGYSGSSIPVPSAVFPSF